MPPQPIDSPNFFILILIVCFVKNWNLEAPIKKWKVYIKNWKAKHFKYITYKIV